MNKVMKPYLMKNIKRAFLLCLLVVTGFAGHAQRITVLTHTLDGNQGKLAVDSLTQVEDSVYFIPNSQLRLETPYYVKDIVTLRINEDAGVLLPLKFDASVNVRIYYTRPDLVVDSVDKQLSLSYNANGTYTNRSSFVFEQAHRIKVKVLGVNVPASATVLKALSLDVEIDAHPVYKLSYATDTVSHITVVNTAVTDTTDELLVRWPDVSGADDYDLEWAFVDDSVLADHRYGTTVNPSLVFQHNATRVTVAPNCYSIPLMYDGEGTLYVRVRAVQEKPKDVRMEMAWGSALGVYHFNGHQGNFNWQSNISYAEDGKRKVVVQYFDGSLRGRQTVTKDNFTKTDLVAETYYDYQGRPAIQVLPSPTLNTAIHYFQNFNRNQLGEEYTKTNYDTLVSTADFLTAAAAPMDSASGVNQYYSSLNPVKEGANRFLPDADGYAFTETSYTQDNTGRISRQGGVGAVHKLGSNHETRYLYGSPGDYDLDILFGTDAGDKTHYFKNAVQDANGQYAISYVDMHGRTVATSLSGKPDTSVSLQDLPDENVVTVTDTLSRRSDNTIKDLSIESSQSQLVTEQGTYSFAYHLSAPALQIKDCNGHVVKYPGLYDLEIKITDDAANRRIDPVNGRPFIAVMHNYIYGTTPDTNITVRNLDTTFNVVLNPGNYEITKTLTVNQAVMDYYRDSIYMQVNHCMTLDQFMAQQRAQFAAQVSCTPVVEARLSAIDEMRNAMLLDVSAPGGQYATTDVIDSVYSIFTGKKDPVLIEPSYKRVHYLDENGAPDMVYDEMTGTLVSPDKLGPIQFGEDFKPEWADSLLRFHPEYDDYVNMQHYSDSYLWDLKLDTVDTYAQAKQLGYLNPLGNNNGLAIVTSGIDPIVNYPEINPYLADKMNHYSGGTTPSMWTLAMVSTKSCNTSDCITLYGTPSKAFNDTVMCAGDLDQAWRAFKNFYLQAKHDLINTKIINVALYDTLVAHHFSPNFISTSDAIAGNGGSFFQSTGHTAQVYSDSIHAQLLRSYDANCRSYVSAWKNQLLTCTYYDSTALVEITNRLVAVCKGGSDSSHPYGASTISPASNNADTSFEQVIESYNAAHGIATSASCNGYLVNSPAPYDRQPAYAYEEIYSKPSDCECSKLNNLHAEYQYNAQSGESFSAYLYRTHQIVISDADLQKLSNGCNATSTCSFMQTPVSLPPGLQCNVGQPCMTCLVMDSLYTQFTGKYPGMTPSMEDSSANQQLVNQLFANFMNSHTGFNKQGWEYVDFMLNECQQSNVLARTNASIGNSCTSLQNIQTSFNAKYGTGSVVTVYKTLPLKSVYHLFNPGAPAYLTLATIAAATWTNGYWYILRDNITFDFSKVAKDATFSDAALNLYAKNGNIEIYTGTGTAHYHESKDTIYGYFENVTTPVIPGTTLASQVVSSPTNRLTIGPLPLNGSNDNYINQHCTPLATDMFNNYLSGADYGMLFRLSREDTSSSHHNAFVFWSDSSRLKNSPITITPATMTVKYQASRCEEFVLYADSVLQYSYSPKQIDSMYSKCGYIICTGEVTYPSYDGPLLCGNNTPLFPTVTVSTSPCEDSSYYITTTGTDLYNAYTDSIKGLFNPAYLQSTMSAGLNEVFTVTYTNREYQYTLYYYDQAGNLVRTIPPAGVVLNRSMDWVNSVRAARAAGLSVTPPHKMATDYRYNTLNQVVTQHSPDGGLSHFWYDRLGRMAISQNGRQALVNHYSYTTYDSLGRITEVGEITSSTAMTSTISRSDANLSSWLTSARATATQITHTNYDVAYDPCRVIIDAQNLRNRVSWTALYNDRPAQDTNGYAAASLYSYDIHGNVDTLVQDFKLGGMSRARNRFKKIVYGYDLVSGKVNYIAYQAGLPDAFYHRYTYDPENRLTNVETSHDSIYWERDAFYQYYKHGPLARVVLGQQHVQGLDYAYTLQGWLKGVNSTAVMPRSDMGSDGVTGSQVAKDAFGFALHYYGDRDYHPIDVTVKPFAAGVNLKPLYNGNISGISQQLPSLGTPLQYRYSYDALNRLVGMQVDSGLNKLTNSWSPVALPDFQESVSYDPNGNILRYQRNGNHTFAGSQLAMDSLTYFYKPGRNQLDYIRDTVGLTAYGNDLDTQAPGNYVYDSIGNLTKDLANGIDTIKWNVYGKISQIIKTNHDTITYTYDVAANRISKMVNRVQTWYVRDATGNVLSIYTKGDPGLNSGDLTQTEAHMYGSSRLGIANLKTDVEHVASADVTNLSLGKGININFTRGKKFFELSNHLGNVLATVSDKRFAISNDSNSVDHYEAELTSSQEYYPFGMLMPGRNGQQTSGGYATGSSVVNGYTVPDNLTVNNRQDNQPAEYAASQSILFAPGFESGSGDAFNAYLADGSYTGGSSGTGGSGSSVATSGYRYGFNGKEDDNEVKGEGNEQDYGMRVYDPRLGKFLSVDPLTKGYPELTPYQFASNTPIVGIDQDGGEIQAVTDWLADKAKAAGNPMLSGFIRSFGAGDFNTLAADLARDVATGNFKAAGGKVLSTASSSTTIGLGMDMVRTTKSAIQGNKEAQGQLIGIGVLMAGGHLVGGGFESAEPTATETPTTVGNTHPVETPATANNSEATAAHGGNTEAATSNAQNSLNSEPTQQTGFKTGVSRSRLLEHIEKYIDPLPRKYKPYAISAMTDLATGKTYIGVNQTLTALDMADPALQGKFPKESMTDWPVYNCAEPGAANAALKIGKASWSNLNDIHTMRWDNQTKRYVDFKMCKNCKVTFQGKSSTSEPTTIK
jgi:RHS repeat-associated protein